MINSCCCKALDCPKTLEFNELYNRISLDSKLAAEIGKMLLEEKKSDQPYDVVKRNYEELVILRKEKAETEKKIKHLLREIKHLKTESSQLKETIETYENEMEKKKLWEHLLVLKADVEDDLKNQVKELEFQLQETKEMLKNVDGQYKTLDENYESLKTSHSELKQEYEAILTYKTNEHNNSNKENCDIFQEVTENAIPEAMPNVPRLQLAPIFPDGKNPFDILQVKTQETFTKICNTDTRVLNRQLRRAFDQIELSEMSNSMIRDIMAELTHFNSQFEWVYDCPDPSIEYFFTLAETVKSILAEVGNLKLTLNDLHTDYVTRIDRLNITSSEPNLLYKLDRRNIEIIANDKRRLNCSSLNNNNNNNNNTNNRKRNSIVVDLFDKLLK